MGMDLEDRDQKGRFKPGHRVKSPGRPKAIIGETYLQTWEKNVGQAEFGEVVVSLIRKAVNGSVEAARIIVNKLIPDEAMRLHVTTDEVRFAGISPAELDSQMMDLLFATIERTKAMEAQVKAEAAGRLASSDTELDGGASIIDVE